MMDFFQNIFSKVISLMASVIIAVGLVSVPKIPEQPLQIEKPREEIVENIEVEEIKQNIEKEKLNEKTNELKQEIQNSLPIPISETKETGQKNKEEMEKKAEEIQKQHEELEKELQLALKGGQEEQTTQQHEPRLVSYRDNLGNFYTDEKDFVRPFNRSFGYSPKCMQMGDNIAYDCHSEVINWVNNRSVEIGKTLNISLDGFDEDGDNIFYFVSYGSRNDFSFGNMRILQSWETNKNFNIPITEQLYNETLGSNLSWSTTFFEETTRKYYEKNVRLENAGELNIQLCFNDKPEKMEYPFGSQFTEGCILFKYFILKPDYSKMEIN